MISSLGPTCLKKCLAIQVSLISIFLVGLLAGVPSIAIIGGVGLVIFQPVSAVMARMKSIEGHSFRRDLYDTVIAAIGFYYLMHFLRLLLLQASLLAISDYLPWMFACATLLVPWFVRHHSKGELLNQIPMLSFFIVCIFINVLSALFDPSSHFVRELGIYLMMVLSPILPVFYLSLEWIEYDQAARKSDCTNE